MAKCHSASYKSYKMQFRSQLAMQPDLNNYFPQNRKRVDEKNFKSGFHKRTNVKEDGEQDDAGGGGEGGADQGGVPLEGGD